jgi:SAM-dependent methyltransferase
MDKPLNSWDFFSKESAANFLRTDGNPSLSSKKILTDILKDIAQHGSLSVIDLGCGNAQLYDYFKECGLNCNYTGVDSSVSLLEAAIASHEGDSNARFIQVDVDSLDGIGGKYDIAVYSHVIEMLASPEASLLQARKIAGKIIIRFFEPPEFEADKVELREMEVGEGRKVPYIRRKMSKDFYRLILTKMGCVSVDIYRDKLFKDQVHVLNY